MARLWERERGRGKGERGESDGKRKGRKVVKEEGEENGERVRKRKGRKEW